MENTCSVLPDRSTLYTEALPSRPHSFDINIVETLNWVGENATANTVKNTERNKMKINVWFTDASGENRFITKRLTFYETIFM